MKMNDCNVMTTRRQQVFEHYVVPEIPVLAHAAIALTQQPADAEDLVQDTLVRAFLGAGRFDGQYPRAWLLTILRNTWAKQSRRHRPELLDDPDSELVGKAAPVVPSREIPEAVVLSEEFYAAVEAAFNALPAKLRSAIALIAIRKLSYAEASRTLGIPLGTVMSRVHHARALIRRRLAAEEGSGEGEDNQPTPQLSVSRSGGTDSRSRQISAAASSANHKSSRQHPASATGSPKPHTPAPSSRGTNSSRTFPRW